MATKKKQKTKKPIKKPVKKASPSKKTASKKRAVKKGAAKKGAAKKSPVKKGSLKKTVTKKKATKKKAAPKKAATTKKTVTKKKAATKKAGKKSGQLSSRQKIVKTSKQQVSKAKSTLKRVVNRAIDRVEALTERVQSQTVNFKFSPLDDRVLVRRDGVSDRTAGGLYIPGSVSDLPLKGRVLAVGPGRKNKKGQLRPMDVQVGDEVVFSNYTGVPVEWQGQDLLILSESEVLGVVKS